MEIYNDKGFSILAIPPKLDVLTAHEVEETLLSLIAEGQNVACDFSKTHYVSSAGLRVMLIATKKAQVAGASLVLFGMSEETRHPFTLSGFDKIMTLRESL